MKQTLFVLFCLATLFSCQQQKIAYVDNSFVINDYQEKKDIEAKYKVKVDAYNKKRDSLGKSLQLEYQEFQLKSKSLNPTDAQAKYDELIQKQQVLQQRFQFEEQQIANESQTEIDSLITKVKGFIKQYGEDNKYTYILGTSDGAASVLYGKEENNISQTILDALNAAYKKK